MHLLQDIQHLFPQIRKRGRVQESREGEVALLVVEGDFALLQGEVVDRVGTDGGG
jgi:hypothetical protein